MDQRRSDMREIAGLCGECAHALIRPTRKGTTYLRCGLAATDPRFPRYPRLPVIACHGFTPLTEDRSQ
ncbi:MAG TPA: hypothetical protein PKH97_10390 [Tetrasphaera sp.]|uniref:hypothetical protein n=1 Tax=Nostocoides sp. TaxID=1917966 RepID=UPI002C0FB2B1|nr:hypothetical protein [Tetrasphaera sp.]HNQ07582.1 hypothetical protein [Tetrasphaera sp.]